MRKLMLIGILLSFFLGGCNPFSESKIEKRIEYKCAYLGYTYAKNGKSKADLNEVLIPILGEIPINDTIIDRFNNERGE